MRIDLAGRVALVTGSTAGIGFAMVVYPAPEQASATTGAALRLDAGVVRGIV